MPFVTKNEEVKQIERGPKDMGGYKLEGSSLLRLMMTGNRIQLKELHFKKGFFHPHHKHEGEESIGYVIKGHLEMCVGDQEYILRDGLVRFVGDISG